MQHFLLSFMIYITNEAKKRAWGGHFSACLHTRVEATIRFQNPDCWEMKGLQEVGTGRRRITGGTQYRFVLSCDSVDRAVWTLGYVRQIQKLHGQTFLPSRVGENPLNSAGILEKLPSHVGNASRSTSGWNCCIALPPHNTLNAELNDRNASRRYCSPQKQRFFITNFLG